MPPNSDEQAAAIRDLLGSISSSVADGPRVGHNTMLSLRMLSEALGSDIFGCQVVLTIPADSANKPIDIAFATSNLAIRGAA